MQAMKDKPTTLWVVDFLAYMFLTFSIGVAVSVVFAGAALLLSEAARAQPAGVAVPAPGSLREVTDDATSMKAGEAGSGTLLFKSGRGSFVAPVLHTDVRIRVSGMVARATVTQTFRNPGEDWLEGVYVFPLPENAAVDHLRMKIGERIVEGRIRERGEAKKVYEQARQAGQRASLLEQERPNIFTTSVANIGPQDEIEVQIEYQQTLRYELGSDGGRYSLRFPMVVGPRYIPGQRTPAGETGSGWGASTTSVADAERITPPVLRPRAGRAPSHPVSLRVELDAGVPLAGIESAYHRIKLRVVAPLQQVIELDTAATPANRDFELSWTVAAGSAPRAAWFTETRGGKHYGLLMIMPPQTATKGARIAREAVFVIDTSGSMEGSSIVQAKEALGLAIERLGADDRFNIIEFNSSARALYPDARPATEANRNEARAWVRGLKARGGTEMRQALELALNGKDSGERIRQVIFLTDGAVGNEEELFRLIRTKLGDSRLFTVGIGSAPNSFFMTQSAKTGGGTFTYIGKVDEVGQKMSELFQKLESPVMKGISIVWPEGAVVESWPRRIPDLYAGEPLVVSAQLDQIQGEVKLSGTRADTRWEQRLVLQQASQGEGMSVLWAREKVAALMDSLREGAPEAETRAKVLELALDHHLVTRYTSLVAVDTTPTRPSDAPVREAAVPTHLPDGWSHEAIFGELPQGSTGSRFHLLVGALCLLLGFALLPRSNKGAGGHHVET